MNTDNFNRYKLEVSPSNYHCIEVNGEKLNHFIAPDTNTGIPKLYMVKNGSEIFYVGITSQGIGVRLRYGFKAAGEKGYYGYKWKDKLTHAELIVWSFPRQDIKFVEAVEGELVYFIREKTGKWPKYQMEIHFHPEVTDTQRQIARSILNECSQKKSLLKLPRGIGGDEWLRKTKEISTMVSSILDNAVSKIARFNDEGLHYNLVANEIYRVRGQIENPFDKSYLPYIIAGLVSFDMGRMMGARKYSFDGSSFAARLDTKLQQVRLWLEPLLAFNLLSIDLQEHGGAIKQAYTALSARGPGALSKNQAKSFHVGATKVLHFLNPELFIMVDSNAARAFKAAHNIPFRKNAPQGYSAKRYFECMKKAQIDISTYGLEEFRALEPSVPLTRVYDKLTFVTGSNPNGTLSKSLHRHE